MSSSLAHVSYPQISVETCDLKTLQVIGLKDVRMDSSTKTLYIVMELMECDLQQVLASDQVMTTQHVKVLLKQLLLGVQAMHVRGVIRECRECCMWMVVPTLVVVVTT